MSTTTIRLPEALKARIARAAEREGVTAHGFILGAVEAKVDELERRRDFHEEADRRWLQFLADGETLDWSQVRASLLRDAQAGAAKPRTRKAARRG
ncbi:MAG: CopG family transcriptional regulator [Luteimonas sp.]|nr:CopG family transcriptional regulator [Luteimonas sp.]